MSAPPPKSVRKYLSQHAEAEARTLVWPTDRVEPFGQVVCIPAHGEGANLFGALASIPNGTRGDNLIVLVVNATLDAPDWVHEANTRTLSRLQQEFGPAKPHGEAIERLCHPTGELWLIDRAGPDAPLPRGQGVGLARKIASDIALAVWASGGLTSPWLHCTDADALLPGDYFERSGAIEPSRSPSPAALLYDFRHTRMADPDIDRAALRYEIFLRYYVLGLQAAGSPWAHQSLGSTLALSPLAYAQVRGFPRRLAAEDFHLLAKLAKLGPLVPLRGAPIELSGRPSSRVPFGTGVGVAKEVERIRAGEPYPAYDPRVFLGVESWLGCLAELGSPPSGGRAHDESSAKEALDRAAERCGFAHPSALWRVVLDGGDAHRALAASGRGLRRQHEGFDALQTLRLIHRLRDEALPSLPLLAALEAAPFVDFALPSDLASVRRQLQERETLRLPGLRSLGSK